MSLRRSGLPGVNAQAGAGGQHFRMLSGIEPSNRPAILRRRASGVAVMALAWLLLLLQGCAGLATVAAVELAVVVAGGAKMAVDPDTTPLPKEVTNRATFYRPAAQVYEVLLTTVERNGRSIVGTEPSAHVMRVSYPFSLLTNNWGGVLTLTCVPQDDATLLLVVGSGRDTTARLRKIGDEIVADLGEALARMPAAP